MSFPLSVFPGMPNCPLSCRSMSGAPSSMTRMVSTCSTSRATRASGKRVRPDLEDRRRGDDAVQPFPEIVVPDAGGDDAERPVLFVERERVEPGALGDPDHFGLLPEEQVEAAPGVHGKEDPVLPLAGPEAVLRPRLARRDRGAAVGQPRDHPDHDGETQLLGEVEGLPGHVVGLLVDSTARSRRPARTGRRSGCPARSASCASPGRRR